MGKDLKGKLHRFSLKRKWSTSKIHSAEKLVNIRKIRRYI